MAGDRSYRLQRNSPWNLGLQQLYKGKGSGAGERASPSIRCPDVVKHLVRYLTMHTRSHARTHTRMCAHTCRGWKEGGRLTSFKDESKGFDHAEKDEGASAAHIRQMEERTCATGRVPISRLERCISSKPSVCMCHAETADRNLQV